MVKALRIAAILISCLALSGCFVSKAPLIPADRAVKLMPDKGRVTAEVIGAPKDANEGQQAFDFQWVGPHYALMNKSGKGGVRKGRWTFADMGQGYFLIQMDKTDEPNEPIEYHLVKRGKAANLDLSFAQCDKLEDAQRRTLKLVMEGRENICSLTSFTQAEGAMKALIKTLTGPNVRLLITPAR